MTLNFSEYVSAVRRKRGLGACESGHLMKSISARRSSPAPARAITGIYCSSLAALKLIYSARSSASPELPTVIQSVSCPLVTTIMLFWIRMSFTISQTSRVNVVSFEFLGVGAPLGVLSDIPLGVWRGSIGAPGSVVSLGVLLSVRSWFTYQRSSSACSPRDGASVSLPMAKLPALALLTTCTSGE